MGNVLDGKSTHEQIQNTISATVSNISVDVLTKQTTVINQFAWQTNVMRKIRVTERMNPCPNGRYGKVDLSQANQAMGEVTASMQNLNTMDLTQKIAKELTAQANSHLSIEKKGIAFSTDSNVRQQINISDTTLTNINTAIKNIQEKFINQSTSQYNYKDEFTFPEPCEDFKLDQKNLLSLVANDISESVTKTVIATEEYKKFATLMGIKEEQKSQDTITSVAETAADAIKEVSKSLGVAAAFAAGGWIILLFGGLLLLIFILPMILRMFTSSKKSKRSREE